jgi:dimeric dUTPase (all-alpha-NTP-PPase superfamily)
MAEEFKSIEIDDFNTIMQAQNELNKKYSGDDWMEKIPKSHFLMAAIAEYGELLESSPRIGDTETGWKWWKPYLENDENNIKIEVVDIVHFLLSSLILTYEDLGQLSIDYNACSTAFSEEENILDSDVSSGKAFDLISTISVYILTSLSASKEEALNTFMFVINALSDYSGMPPSEMVELYLKKNELNHKRVEGGYMESADAYEKVDKDGNEDNTKLFD